MLTVLLTWCISFQTKNMDAFFQSPQIEMKKLMSLSHIPMSTQNHLKKVYACMTVGLLFSAAGALTNLKYHFIGQSSFFSFIVILGASLYLGSVPHTDKNLVKRLSVLFGLAFFMGMSTAPLIEFAMFIDPSIVVTAFTGTCLIIACFTVSALLAKRRSYLYLGGILSSLSLVLLISTLFMRHPSLSQLSGLLYFSTAITCGYIIYDTQIIVEKHLLGDNDFVFHSIRMIIDFIHLFKKLVLLLSVNNEKKKKKN